MIVKALENKFEMFDMCFLVSTLKEEVVKICITKLHATSYVIDKTLKCLSCISQAVRHSKVLGKTEYCGDGCFMDVGRVHWYLMIRLCEIDFGEDGGAMKRRYKICGVWE